MTETYSDSSYMQDDMSEFENLLLIKSVFPVGKSRWINIELSGGSRNGQSNFSGSSSNKVYKLVGDVYFSPGFSLGVKYRTIAGDVSRHKGEKRGIRLGLYMGDNLYIKANYNKFTSSAGYEDYEELRVQTGLRF